MIEDRPCEVQCYGVEKGSCLTGAATISRGGSVAIVTHASVAVALTGLLSMESKDMLAESKAVGGGVVGPRLMAALDRMDSARTAGVLALRSC